MEMESGRRNRTEIFKVECTKFTAWSKGLRMAPISMHNGKILYTFVKGRDLGKSNRRAKRLTPRRKCSVVAVKSDDSYDVPYFFLESSSCL